MPVGTILPYTGDLNKIPYGWAVCDGSHGTPDLRDRFIVGAGLSYTLKDIGGENYHQLTIKEMPKHSHNIFSFINITGAAGGGNRNPLYRTNSFELTFPAGDDQPHENRPPYYAVYYIMRIN